jgi:hypothetical protein
MFNSIKDHANDGLQWAASGSRLTYAAVIVGLMIGLILFRFFFRNIAGLFHSIGFSFGSGGNPAVAAEPGLCTSSRLKLLLILLVPAGFAYAAYMFLPGFFPAVFK